jgi:K+-sensing histidine kinase KdpD
MDKKIVLQDIKSQEKHRVFFPCIIGRGKDADLSLSDLGVSHKHALLTRKNNQVWIEDLGSINGVFVNGWKITENTLVHPGDSVQLGDLTFIVSEMEEDISEQTVVLHTIVAHAETALDHKKLAAIYEITAELSDNQDIKELCRKIFSRLKEIFKYERGYIALFEPDGSLKPLLADPHLETIPLSSSIVNRVFANAESFLLEDALGDASLGVTESVIIHKIRSALCVALIYNNQIYGLMYLDRNIPGAYSPQDLEFFKSIASILAPLIENARLWTELKNHYDSAVETLKKTQARLIETERTAAYVRLAQAMAHELRNPLMIIGGMVRKIARISPAEEINETVDALMNSVERMEMVLKEVDDFVKIPLPQMRLRRIDHIIQDEIERQESQLKNKSINAVLSVCTPHVMIPLDPHMLQKAVSMILKEVVLSMQQGSELSIKISDMNNEIEVVFGETDSMEYFCDLYDAELLSKPWSTSLFLSVAHKILADHGGRLLLDPRAQIAFPLILKLPRTIEVE